MAVAIRFSTLLYVGDYCILNTKLNSVWNLFRSCYVIFMDIACRSRQYVSTNSTVFLFSYWGRVSCSAVDVLSMGNWEC